MAKATYVDGFVLVVSKKKVGEYRKLARDAAKVWKRFGALSYRECMGRDLKPKWIILTFPKMAKVKANETVWFSYIEYKSRKHRDQTNKKGMAYFAKKYGNKKDFPMPFDMKRVAYGGFTIEASA